MLKIKQVAIYIQLEQAIQTSWPILIRSTICYFYVLLISHSMIL